MRYVIIVLWMLFGSVTSAVAQVSIGIGLPGVNIGINLGGYPQLVQVPGYPVYYAPQLDSNYFFYDGLYWVYERDNWYASSWYNGPWGLVGAEYVPLYMLRVPVRYYRQPPGYFRGWRADAPPRWGEHWGHELAQRRRGWDRWDHASAPRPAPLPVYQRQYSGDRYPRVEQQHALHSQNYRYQPRDAVVRQHYQEQAKQRAPAPSQRGLQEAPRERTTRQQQDSQRSNPPPRSDPAAPRAQPREDAQKSVPTQAPPQQKGAATHDQTQQPRPVQREQQTPRSNQENIPQGKGASQGPGRGQGQEQDREKQGKGASQEPRQGQEKKDREKGEERGQERNR